MFIGEGKIKRLQCILISVRSITCLTGLSFLVLKAVFNLLKVCKIFIVIKIYNWFSCVCRKLWILWVGHIVELIYSFFKIGYCFNKITIHSVHNDWVVFRKISTSTQELRYSYIVSLLIPDFDTCISVFVRVAMPISNNAILFVCQLHYSSQFLKGFQFQ